jgi:hypothetical protein
VAAPVEILERIPEARRRTLSWDQAREMAMYHELAELGDIDLHSCRTPLALVAPDERTWIAACITEGVAFRGGEPPTVVSGGTSAVTDFG